MEKKKRKQRQSHEDNQNSIRLGFFSQCASARESADEEKPASLEAAILLPGLVVLHARFSPLLSPPLLRRSHFSHFT
jgi:hypothetical protein